MEFLKKIFNDDCIIIGISTFKGFGPEYSTSQIGAGFLNQPEKKEIYKTNTENNLLLL